jgi:hypothetical protein
MLFSCCNRSGAQRSGWQHHVDTPQGAPFEHRNEPADPLNKVSLALNGGVALSLT